MDMRYKKNREYACLVKRNTRLGLFTLWVLVVLGFLILIQSINQPQRPLLDPRGKEPISMVQKVKAAEPPFCKDAISCIRDVGTEIGESNYDIMAMIRLAKCESGMRGDALNKNTNGTFDVGLLQINDVHGKRISRGDRLDYQKNIRFAYKLHQEQGHRFTAWSCWRKIIK